jgi:hypothetical protein
MTGRDVRYAVQPAEHWDEKAVKAEEIASAMGVSPSKVSMIEIAQLYRQLAEQTRKLENERRNKP